jgi:cyclophilin family peptidyl-prolyl cis-trans isomerase
LQLIKSLTFAFFFDRVNFKQFIQQFCWQGEIMTDNNDNDGTQNNKVPEPHFYDEQSRKSQESFVVSFPAPAATPVKKEEVATPPPINCLNQED